MEYRVSHVSLLAMPRKLEPFPGSFLAYHVNFANWHQKLYAKLL